MKKRILPLLFGSLLVLTLASAQSSRQTPPTASLDNYATKLPRVDVTHADFGARSGCPNPADKSGRLDSTCAIKAAIAWALAHPQGSMYPVVYLPAGTYKISDALRIPANLKIMGDGKVDTVIEQTSNSANIFTVYPPPSAIQPDTWIFDGMLEKLRLYSPNDHDYKADFVELDDAVGFRLFDVEIDNGGGRGIQMNGSTERVDSIDLTINTVRWPVVALGNELRFLNTNLASPGADSTGYCFGANCVNGVFPGYKWKQPQRLISARGNGTTATYIIAGGDNPDSSNGISPLVAGHWFTVAGIRDVTGLNGAYQIESVTDHSPARGEYTIRAANTASGTATVVGATYKPTILPSNQAGAFFMMGAAIDVIGGSIKANWHEGCFETQSVFSGLIQGFYCEGYPINGQPHENASILANGLPPWTSTTGEISHNAVPVASTEWMPNYVNDPGDVAALHLGGSAYRIMPRDFTRGSHSASSYVPGVQRDQYENLSGIFAGDGRFHIFRRNEKGSTAPADTNWPAGSIIAEVPQPNYGILKVADSHLESVDYPGSNWAAYCNDSNQYICSEAIVGNIPNGYTTFSSGSAAGAANITVDFDDDEWWGFCSQAKLYGEGCVKVSILGNVIGVPSSNRGETYEAYHGQFLNSSNVYAVQEADGSYAGMSYTDAGSQLVGNSFGHTLTHYIDSYGDPVLGQNPGMSYAFGNQFMNSQCWYDTPPEGQPHALSRFCIVGGPKNTGISQRLQYDQWVNSAWVTRFSVNPNQAKISGQPIATDQYQGTVRFAAGTATVSSPATPPNRQSIAIWNCGPAGAVGVPELISIRPGNSFTIRSSSPGDASTVCWWIH
ncbi:MAG TPA: glycosyl hydrolase family 28-related protein [Acidobacteriaceae bacterium]|nr:glycosyl hydrolase family 28-related protein [Acidobacteriaceae bacterium]